MINHTHKHRKRQGRSRKCGENSIEREQNAKVLYHFLHANVSRSVLGISSSLTEVPDTHLEIVKIA